MPRKLSLTETVRPHQRMDAGPLGQLRWAMSELGLYDPTLDPGSTERRMSRKQRKALQETQGRHGLAQDAVVHPGGPTEELLNNMLAQGRSSWGSAGGHGLDSTSRARREATPGALVGRVGPGRENHPEDVTTVSAALHNLDPSESSAGRPLRIPEVAKKLKEFQRGARLVPDGIITPGGPTERALSLSLAQSVPGTPGTDAAVPVLAAPPPRHQRPAPAVLQPREPLHDMANTEPELLSGGADDDILHGNASDDILLDGGTADPLSGPSGIAGATGPEIDYGPPPPEPVEPEADRPRTGAFQAETNQPATSPPSSPPDLTPEQQRLELKRHEALMILRGFERIDEAQPNPTPHRLSPEEHEAQRAAAKRRLDRYLQVEHGVPIDNPSDDVALIRDQRQYEMAGPEERARLRNRERELMAPQPEKPIDASEIAGLDVTRGHGLTSTLVRVYAESSPEERANMREAQIQRILETGLERDEISDAQKEAASDGFIWTDGPPNPNPELLELARAAYARERGAAGKLKRELTRYIIPAREKDRIPAGENERRTVEGQNVANFFESLAELDGNGELGRWLASFAQNVNAGISLEPRYSMTVDDADGPMGAGPGRDAPMEQHRWYRIPTTR